MSAERHPHSWFHDVAALPCIAFVALAFGWALLWALLLATIFRMIV